MELLTRWTLYALPWIMLVVMAGPLPGRLRDEGVAGGLAWAQLGLSAVQSVLAIPLLRRGIEHRRREREVPWGLLALATVPMVAGQGVGVAVLSTVGAPDGSAFMTAVTMNTLPFSLSSALLLSVRAFILLHAGIGAATLAALAVAGEGPFMVVGSAFAVLLMAALALFTVRSSIWMLVVMWELDASREVQARLAVAEERLRFGRDLHDVMGRNLAVIALKSELAVQLARRGRPEAAEQMAEVQRIAQESQREVRDVVRGYRGADLQVELAGARSLLRAARVDCRIEYPGGDGGVDEGGGEGGGGGWAGGLPAAVRSALGWVVREGTTNVLRHAEAARCTVRVALSRTADGGRTAVLVMENDGVSDLGTSASAGTAGTAGNGLKGLRERLAPLGGTLWSGPGEGGTYRLRAELPLSADPGREGREGRQGREGREGRQGREGGGV
ncbi:sensor histidine kinase [Streptomyces sparsogenes]|uniref:Two-component system sensor kinase n=1 Tax=Streptomyces sparsogenes DSM 40356 TaxID=1331668 RepID=A0A1R1SLI8_9ACTN|nr:histidine kinase [Streptomyces sparsogenes]OMI39160.1 two-component system sensor kinase [Streptomyces sparsogenes DSM 40356]